MIIQLESDGTYSVVENSTPDPSGALPNLCKGLTLEQAMGVFKVYEIGVRYGQSRIKNQMKQLGWLI